MHSFNKVLIGIAFSPGLKPNLFEAIRLVNMFQAQLICVHVGKRTEEKDNILNAIFTGTDKPNKEIKVIWQEGKPVDVILNICSTENIDLLILGALQKENLYRYYVGSIARKITRKAPCSVLLLIKPSIERVPCKHIVVNGLKDLKTKETIETAVYVSKELNCTKITIVEEISQSEVHVKVNDDKSLRKANILKERIKQREDFRVRDILKSIDTQNIKIISQSIFGKRGYSIGHYAKVVRADLLVMNAPNKTGLLDRVFVHDIEFILSELPTDVLIVK